MFRRPFWLIITLLGCDTEAPWASQHASIVNGTRAPEVVPLSPNQVRAIGWLHPAGSASDNYCTGTLIAPRVVATAEHCVTGADASEIGFGFGLEPASPEGSFEASAIYAHPGEDAALLVLSESATVAPWFLTPIPANADPILPSSVGKALEAAGYGDTMDPNREGRWFATVYLDQVGSQEVVVDGRGLEGICHGDSGGPLLDTNASGQPVVLAVESWGDSSCVDQDVMVRLDALADWMAPVLSGGSPLDPCDGLSELGRCTGDLLEWCQRGEIRALDCAALGTNCGQLSAAAGYDCLCGELDCLGRCDRGVAEYCDEGAYRRVNCERRGEACAWIDEQTGYFCTDTPVCRAEDEAGRCDGDVAMSCSDGLNTRRLCAVEGLSCRSTASGVDCVEPDLGPPDSGPSQPTLDAGVDAGGATPASDLDGADGERASDASVPADAAGSEEEDDGCGCASTAPMPLGGPSTLTWWLLLASFLGAGSARVSSRKEGGRHVASNSVGVGARVARRV